LPLSSRERFVVHGDSGSWAGATRAPEGKDNVKGQACLGCKRNSLLPLTQYAIVLDLVHDLV